MLGKTTVAKLYARILCDLGILSKGEVIMKTASDFVGGAIGKSEEMTRNLLEQAKGSVLVIDEAYGLYQGTSAVKGQNEPYRDAVINTLVEQIQGLPGEDRVVLLLGYREEMEAMLANVNPGLSRRFQLESAFQFQDYDDASLRRILIKAVKVKGLTITDEVSTFAIKQLAKAKAQPHFGNAGAVNNLLSTAILRMQKRIANQPLSLSLPPALGDLRLKQVDIDKDALVKEDFVPEGWTDEVLSIDQLLAKFVGNEAIKEKLQNYSNLIFYNQKKGRERTLNLPYNFLFVGAPGTGKTTVARLMGKMFESFQLIPTSEVVELSASDFTTGFVGQSGQQTRKIFEKARGKVLFIDEAYQLNPAKGGQFMSEVIDEMVKLMTSEDYLKKMVIILAGYEQEIDEMLEVNPGLRSRFQERFTFVNFSEAQTKALIAQKLKENNEETMEETAERILSSIARELIVLPNFSNGRDVETFVTKIIQQKVSRLHRNDSEITLASDLLGALDEFKKLKRSTMKTTPAAGEVPPPATKTAAMSNFDKAPIFIMDTDKENSANSAVEEKEIEQMELEKEEMEVEEVHPRSAPGGKGVDGTALNWGNERLLKSMQDMLTRDGWNSKENYETIANYNINHAYMKQLIQQLVNETGYSTQEVINFMKKWQSNQKTVTQIRKELEKKKIKMVPIWRCAVCGSYSCSFAPYIESYQRI